MSDLKTVAQAEKAILKLMLEAAFEAGRRRGFYQESGTPNDTVEFDAWYDREWGK